MTREPDAAKVRFLPPGIPLLAIGAGYLLNQAIPFNFTLGMSDTARYLLGGLIAVCAVLFLGLRAVLLFRSEGQSENPWTPTPAIEERYPFSITRNPMYLQMILVCLGVGIGLANGWILVLLPVVAFLLQKLAIEPEEVYLEHKFGEPYLEYKSRVRRWI